MSLDLSRRSTESDRTPSVVRWLRGPAAGPSVLLLVGAVYWAVTALVQMLDFLDSQAGLWPAAGFTVASLLLLPTRLWPWALAGVLIAETSNDLVSGASLVLSLGWAAGNVVEPLVGATLLRRAGNRRGSLTTLGGVLQFLAFAVVAAPLVGGTIGALTTVASSGDPLRTVWPQYVVGDALGVLVVAPVLLTWRTERTVRTRWEGLALWGGALTTSTVLFSNVGGLWTVTMAYLLIPFFTWAALRYGVLMVAQLSLVVALLANSLTMAGGGVFANASLPGDHSLVLLQTFFGVAVSTALILAVLVGDLSDRREVERVLRHQASHDLLTGLPNRAVLADALDESLAALPAPTGADGEPRVALLVCDLDHFKTVNDTHGHTAGDAFLVAVAQRLRASVRDEDLVARISGDEFVILLREADTQAVDTVCERVLETVGRPVALPSGTTVRKVVPSLSMGVARSGPGASAESLFRGADAALYEAKRLGRGRVVHVDDGLRARALEQDDMERTLAAALVGDQLHVVHEPVVALGDGHVAGFESVARWNHPVHGTLSFEQFAPTVEAAGRTGELFGLVLAQSLEAQKHWAKLLGFAPPVTLRLPNAQLSDPLLPQFVSVALTRADAHASNLWLEVSESAPLDDAALATLETLRQIGVHLAIVGFGSGPGPLGRIDVHPWDCVLIDRVLVEPLARTESSDRLVAAMVAMAHTLGMPTLAEGVDTALQRERLAALGCDLGQGRALGRPVPAAQAATLLRGEGRSTSDALPGQFVPQARNGAADSGT